jgi:CspA family cold shock protein
MQGAIKRIVADKGFGFIRGEDGVEYFVHRTAVLGIAFKTVREGQRVTFNPTRHDKGPRAEQVQLA